MSKGLKKLMKKVAADSNEQLAVADSKLGSIIKKKTDIDCVYSSNVMELMRCIRSQMPELVAGGDDKVSWFIVKLDFRQNILKEKHKYGSRNILS